MSQKSPPRGVGAPEEHLWVSFRPGLLRHLLDSCAAGVGLATSAEELHLRVRGARLDGGSFELYGMPVLLGGPCSACSSS
eukprot:3291690-Amphidinium_carterae.1